MKILGGARIRFAAVALLGAALAIAAPVAAAAAPATPQKASPTTTTTTKPGTAAAFAKLVIKADSVGHVKVEAAGASTFKPAKNGQSLHVGDTVQTDASGQAEIDYADTAYTRLDVNTTFTIKKLTDSQGNRQVEGSLDVGRTYNRTAALTQSQTFQQDAGGATAAVAGTAFVVTCTSATTCTFTAVIDNINLTGNGGETKTLNPLDECVDSNGALCGTTTRLTPDELALIQWIQTNVLADLTEHGIGDGVFQPFAATVTVNNGVVQSVSPAPAAPPGSPPPPPPPPPPPDNDLTISTAPNQTATATGANGAPVAFSKPTASDESGETPAVVCDNTSGATFPVGTTTVTCTATDSDDSNGPVQSSFTVTVTPMPPTVNQANPVCTPPSCTPQSGLAINTDGDGNTLGGDSVNFQLSGGTDPNNPSGLQYQFTTLPSPSSGTIFTSSVAVDPALTYAPSTPFEYAATENGEVATNGSFQYKAVDNSTHLQSAPATVNVTGNGE